MASRLYDLLNRTVSEYPGLKLESDKIEAALNAWASRVSLHGFGKFTEALQTARANNPGFFPDPTQIDQCLKSEQYVPQRILADPNCAVCGGTGFEPIFIGKDRGVRSCQCRKIAQEQVKLHGWEGLRYTPKPTDKREDVLNSDEYRRWKLALQKFKPKEL